MEAIQDGSLGKITYNDQLRWYEAEVDNYRLYLSCEDQNQANQCLTHTQSYLQERSELNQKAAVFSCESLISIKNDTWLEDDEKALSKDQFISRLTLESVTIYPDASMEFAFEDGDLFWGHVILVSYENSKFTEAGIAG